MPQTVVGGAFKYAPIDAAQVCWPKQKDELRQLRAMVRMVGYSEWSGGGS